MPVRDGDTGLRLPQPPARLPDSFPGSPWTTNVPSQMMHLDYSTDEKPLRIPPT